MSIIAVIKQNTSYSHSWVGAIYPDGSIVSKLPSRSQEESPELAVLVQGLLNNGSSHSPDNSDVYSACLNKFGLSPTTLLDVLKDLEIDHGLYIRNLDSLIKQMPSKEYRLAILENSPDSQNKLESCGLNPQDDYPNVTEDGEVVEPETIKSADYSKDRKVCKYCGLGWTRNSGNPVSRIIRFMSKGYGLFNAHMTCASIFSQTYQRLEKQVVKDMQDVAYKVIDGAMDGHHHYNGLSDVVLQSGCSLALLPMQIHALDSKSRHAEIIYSIHAGFFRNINNRLNDRIMEVDEIRTANEIISKYNLLQVNNPYLNSDSVKTVTERLRVSEKLQEYFAGNTDFYVGPPRETLPFPRDLEILWVWPNIQYQEVRQVADTVSQRNYSGTAAGVNSSATLGVDFRSTKDFRDTIAPLGSGYLALNRSGLHYIGDNSCSVRFSDMIALTGNEEGVTFQEDGRQGRRSRPRRFVSYDGWQLRVVIPTFYRDRSV